MDGQLPDLTLPKRDRHIDRLVARQHGLCWICLKPMRPPGNHKNAASTDHMIARAIGGDTSFQNKLAAHRRCNSARNEALPVIDGRVFEVTERDAAVAAALARIDEALRRSATAI